MINATILDGIANLFTKRERLTSARRTGLEPLSLLHNIPIDAELLYVQHRMGT